MCLLMGNFIDLYIITILLLLISVINFELSFYDSRFTFRDGGDEGNGYVERFFDDSQILAGVGGKFGEAGDALRGSFPAGIDFINRLAFSQLAQIERQF